jgi:hypothetical protein
MVGPNSFSFNYNGFQSFMKLLFQYISIKDNKQSTSSFQKVFQSHLISSVKKSHNVSQFIPLQDDE